MFSNLPARASAPVDSFCPRHRQLDVLLVRVGGGDRDAFSALYDELVQTVYGMSLNGGHDPLLAARITFDVFLCAWLQAGAYDPEAEPAWTWVRAIAATTIAAQAVTLHVNQTVSPGTPTHGGAKGSDVPTSVRLAQRFVSGVAVRRTHRKGGVDA